MPKTRLQKEAIIESLKERLADSQSVVLVGITGVKVEEVEQVRDALFPSGLKLQVAKNTLLARVLKDAGIEVSTEILDQPLGLIYSPEDPVSGPKAVAPLAKDIESLEILGGIMDGAFISPSQVVALSKLPSRDQLYGQLVGTLQAPISGLVNVLAGNIRGLVTVLGQIRDAKPAA